MKTCWLLFALLNTFFLTLETFLENVRPSVPSVRTRPSACLSVSIMRYMYRCLPKYAFSSHRMGFQFTCILINLVNGKTPKMLQFCSYLDIFWAHDFGSDTLLFCYVPFDIFTFCTVDYEWLSFYHGKNPEIFS